MPWVSTNAKMEWTGVYADKQKQEEVKSLVEDRIPVLEGQLAQMGIQNARSHKQLRDFFKGEGLISHFIRDGEITFDRDQLKFNQHIHPSVSILRKLRRASDLVADKIMGNDLVGADGRFHPQYRQLGTDTGRQTSQYPNIMGLDHLLRTLIVPGEGYGIGEAE